MLSIVVLTKNEEERIKACLESVKWADEIIVADNGSSDKTLEICRKYTDKIIINKSPDFDLRRNEAIEKTSGDWVLYIDADERVLESLKKEIQEIIGSSEFSALAISRINVIFGKKVAYGPYKNDWVIRLLKKSEFKNWVGKVHEYPTFNGKLGYTKSSLLHLTHRDLDHFILKSLEWSKIDAKLRQDVHHPKMSGWRFLRIFITETWNQGVIRGGFFAGSVGIIDSLLQVFSMLMSYIRLWEMQQKPQLKEVYENLDQKLIKDGFNFK